MLKTVKVPKSLIPIFEKAENNVKRFFETKEVNVSKATIKISDERYLLVRASSLSIDFFKCVTDLFNQKNHNEGVQITRQLLFDISHAIGMKDAEHFQKEMNLTNPIDILAAGPVHFAHTGWASVTIFPESKPSADDNFVLFYEHPYSFEADAWHKAGEKSEIPVCIMSAGYSSGWCEKSFGIPLVATETTCRAKGDKSCCFVMAHPSKIEKYIKEQFKKQPQICEKQTDFEIPNFFNIKKVEAELRATNIKLTESNDELLQKTKAIELLSEMGEDLPKCSSKKEIYRVFYKYTSKLFPNMDTHLWVLTKDKSKLKPVHKKHQSLTLFAPEKCKSLQAGKVYHHAHKSNAHHCDHIEKHNLGYICAPISTGDELFGLMTIIFGNTKFSKDQQQLVSRVAGDVALALTNVQLRESLHEISIRDYLTDLYNRRYMEEMLNQEIARAIRLKSQIGLIMLDIDHFKKYNDTFGHEAGDNILVTLGKMLKDHFRKGDVVCRFGGEEFLIILSNINKNQVIKKAENLRKKIKSLRMKTNDQLFKGLTISAGVAVFPEDGKNVKALLNKVDKALYRAKKEGRNRVCPASS